MTHAVQMLRAHPGAIQAGVDLLAEGIDACFDCAETCTACGDACLGEPDVRELRNCIRMNLDCVDVCEATGKLLSRQTGMNAEVVVAQLRACIAACQACADECARHAARHDHCRICAEACLRCVRACEELICGPSVSS